MLKKTQEIANIYLGISYLSHVVHMGEIRNAYKVLVGKPERKDHVEGLGIFKMDLKEGGWESVDQIHLTRDRDQWLALINT
jgi:hypothetical protein